MASTSPSGGNSRASMMPELGSSCHAAATAASNASRKATIWD